MKKNLDLGNTTAKPESSEHHFYELMQPDAPILLQDYILTDNASGKYCLLRWIKNFEYSITSIKLELTELDDSAMTCSVRCITFTEADLTQVNLGETFVPKSGIAVDPKCVSIRVKLIELQSDAYIYRLENEKIVIDYQITPPQPTSKAKKRRKYKRTQLSVLKADRRLLGWAVALSVIILILVFVAPYIYVFIPLETIKRIIVKNVNWFFKVSWRAIQQFFDSLIQAISTFFESLFQG